MHIQLFLLALFTALPALSSQVHQAQSNIQISIDDHLTDPRKYVIVVTDFIPNAEEGDVAYKMKLNLKTSRTPDFKEHHEWITKYYRIKHEKESEEAQEPTRTMVNITDKEIPQEKKKEFFRLLNEAGWRHIYLHRLDNLDLTWDTFRNQNPAQFCPDPHMWLAKLITMRKTIWCAKTGDQYPSFLCQEEKGRLQRKIFRDGALLSYQQHKTKKHKKILQEAEDYCAYDLRRDTEKLSFFTSNFLLWRKGVYQEVERERALIQEKIDREEYNHKQRALLFKQEAQRKLLREKHKKSLNKILEKRPKKLKDFFKNKEMKARMHATEKENRLLKAQCKREESGGRLNSRKN